MKNVNWKAWLLMDYKEIKFSYIIHHPQLILASLKKSVKYAEQNWVSRGRSMHCICFWFSRDATVSHPHFSHLLNDVSWNPSKKDSMYVRSVSLAWARIEISWANVFNFVLVPELLWVIHAKIISISTKLKIKSCLFLTLYWVTSLKYRW